MTAAPYNPLDKLNLARSIEGELLSREATRLGGLTEVAGAGVYAIYYVGAFALYDPLTRLNSNNAFAANLCRKSDSTRRSERGIDAGLTIEPRALGSSETARVIDRGGIKYRSRSFFYTTPCRGRHLDTAW